MRHRRLRAQTTAPRPRAWRDFLERERAASTVELGLLLPVFVLIVLGVADVGRIAYAAVTLSHGARAGAAYGGQMVATVGDTSGIRVAAQAEAVEISPVSVSSRFYCTCETGSAADCVTASCGAYGPPLLYVEVTTAKSVNMVLPFPGVPTTVSLSRTATLRVQ